MDKINNAEARRKIFLTKTLLTSNPTQLLQSLIKRKEGKTEDLSFIFQTHLVIAGIFLESPLKHGIHIIFLFALHSL